MATPKNTTATKDIVPFAVYGVDDNSLTFYADTKIPRKGDVYKDRLASHVFKVNLSDENTTLPMWSRTNDVVANTESVYIDPSFEVIKLPSLANFFSGLENCRTIDVSNLVTSATQNFACLFFGCKSLVTIEGLENWDTSSVVFMNSAFNGCKNLERIDISNWDTSSVRDIGCMFAECKNLTHLSLPTFSPNCITNIEYVFSDCSSLVELDLSSWDTSSVENMSSMFSGCTSLKSLNMGGWDTSAATDMSEMFEGCTNLTKVVGSDKWLITSDVDTYNMFEGCSSLSLDRVFRVGQHKTNGNKTCWSPAGYSFNISSGV